MAVESFMECQEIKNEIIRSLGRRKFEYKIFIKTIPGGYKKSPKYSIDIYSFSKKLDPGDLMNLFAEDQNEVIIYNLDAFVP